MWFLWELFLLLCAVVFWVSFCTLARRSCRRQRDLANQPQYVVHQVPPGTRGNQRHPPYNQYAVYNQGYQPNQPYPPPGGFPRNQAYPPPGGFPRNQAYQQPLGFNMNNYNSQNGQPNYGHPFSVENQYAIYQNLDKPPSYDEVVQPQPPAAAPFAASAASPASAASAAQEPAPAYVADPLGAAPVGSTTAPPAASPAAPEPAPASPARPA